MGAGKKEESIKSAVLLSTLLIRPPTDSPGAVVRGVHHVAGTRPSGRVACPVWVAAVVQTDLGLADFSIVALEGETVKSYHTEVFVLCDVRVQRMK